MEGLESIAWLAALGAGEWEVLRTRATRLSYSAGETVFAPTPDPHSIYILEQGRIRILRISSTGDEVTLGYVAEGEVFGELPGFGDHPRESFAVARAPSTVWRVPLTLFREWISSRPPIALEITRQMGDRMKRVESRVENLVFGDVRSRLAKVLLELAEDFGRTNGDTCIIDIGISQGELATLIGSTRQSVNAAMGALKDDGILRLSGRRTELLDQERLRTIARSNRGQEREKSGASDESGD
ncbi:MAG: Crp/Fnr family transcriptional regulator [Myxococcota bacterium]|nr:Crp/Fnr family transcriptional regulator [Myxococcota bacterium]